MGADALFVVPRLSPTTALSTAGPITAMLCIILIRHSSIYPADNLGGNLIMYTYIGWCNERARRRAFDHQQKTMHDIEAAGAQRKGSNRYGRLQKPNLLCHMCLNFEHLELEIFLVRIASKGFSCKLSVLLTRLSFETYVGNFGSHCKHVKI
jgi:hypothetical protein